MQTSGNLLNFSIPVGGPTIYACGAFINGSISTPFSPSLSTTTSQTPSTTSNSTVTAIPPPPPPPPPSSDLGVVWWGIAIAVIAFVVICSAVTIGVSIAFYNWKSKQLNQYAIMN